MSYAEQLHAIEKIADYGWNYFSGYLHDIRLEKALKKIADEYACEQEIICNNFARNAVSLRILHIATELYDVGGHSRVIKSWIGQDKNNLNDILITNQKEKLNENFFHSFDIANKIEVLPSVYDHFERFKVIVDFIVKNHYDLIVLHIHPSDAVTIAALYIKKFPKVIFYNHADHVYSLGTTAAHAVIDFRKIGKEYSLKYRNVLNSHVLPYPLEKKPVNMTGNEKETIKSNLGVDGYDRIMITMASHYKYQPIKHINFLRDYYSFCKKNESVVLLVIGVSEDIYYQYSKQSEIPNNLKLLGYIVDPGTYLSIADFFIEPYPFGTGLGTYDAMQYGMIPITSIHDISIYGKSVSSIIPDDSLGFHFPENADDYWKQLNRFVNMPLKSDKIQTIKKSILKTVQESEAPIWIEKVFSIYKYILEDKNSKETITEEYKNLLLTDKYAVLFAQWNYKGIRKSLKILKTYSFFNVSIKIYLRAAFIFILNGEFKDDKFKKSFKSRISTYLKF